MRRGAIRRRYGRQLVWQIDRARLREAAEVGSSVAIRRLLDPVDRRPASASAIAGAQSSAKAGWRSSRRRAEGRPPVLERRSKAARGRSADRPRPASRTDPGPRLHPVDRPRDRGRRAQPWQNRSPRPDRRLPWRPPCSHRRRGRSSKARALPARARWRSRRRWHCHRRRAPWRQPPPRSAVAPLPSPAHCARPVS